VALVVLFLATTAIAGIPGSAGHDGAASGPKPRAAHGGAEWRMGGHDLQNSRHAAAEVKIGPNNVARLAPRWVFAQGGDVSATPAVDGSAVYFPDWQGHLFKLDAATGQVVWSRSIADYTGVPGAVSRTSPALDGDNLIIGSQEGGYVMAVDRGTGDLVWRTKADPHPAANITQSPVVFGGRVFVGVSSNEELFAANPAYPCCTFRGSVLALDARTGAVIWRGYTVPPGYSGGAVWGSTPVIDPKRGAVYITTGNNYSVPAEVADCAEVAIDDAEAAACLAEDDYVDSILAFDLRDGTRKWGTRVQGFDAWTIACILPPTPANWCPFPTSPDYDFGSGPNLFTVHAGGAPRDLLGAGQKSGIYWALDPDDGSVVWSTLVGPGGPAGGIQWGSATDGERVYVAINNGFHQPYTLSPSGETITWGSWSALDAATGEILWQTPDPTAGAGDMGAVTLANDVVYAASMDPLGHFYALDARSGDVLWSFESGGSSVAGPAIVDGSVYWGSGYARLGFGTSGPRKMVAFDLH
jgi:polyvinyl alcohol dehydrogenase (cytochrome)